MGKLIDFVCDNWKPLLIAGGAVVGVALLLKSKMWLGNLTDDELGEKREKTRIRYTEANDDTEATILYNQLSRYDDEMIARSNARYDKENPNAEPRHREHGWYLENDD